MQEPLSRKNDIGEKSVSEKPILGKNGLGNTDLGKTRFCKNRFWKIDLARNISVGFDNFFIEDSIDSDGEQP